MLEISAYDKMRMGDLLPGHIAGNNDLHQDINQRDAAHRNKYTSWDIDLRLGDLAAQMAHIVIAQVRINRLQRCLPQANPEYCVQPDPAITAKGERPMRIKVH